MVKFCTFCGKQIEEGETCSCREKVASNVFQQPQQQYQAPQQQYQAPQQQYQVPQQQYQQQFQQQPNVVAFKENGFGKFCTNMFELFIRFMKSPAELIKLVAKNQDFKAGLFFGAIQCILTSLIILLFIKKGIGFVTGLFGISSYSSLLRGYVDIPYLSIFFKTLVVMILQYFLLAGIIFGIGKIFKGANSFKGITGVIGVASIPVSLSLLASALFVFIYSSFIPLLLIFGVFMSLLVVKVGTSEALQINENNIIYLISISYFAYYLLVFWILIRNSIF